MDEVKTIGNVELLRKCKSCKNNITTVIKEGLVIINKIDTKANALNILNGSTGALRKR